MKLVRELLNEKFTEKSDPVHDMGIGIDKLIRDFMRNDIEEYEDDQDAETTNINIILGYCVIYEKEDFVDYLLGKGADINNKHVNSWFKFACEYGHTGVVKLLIDKGFNFHGNAGEGYEKGLRIAIANKQLGVVKLLVEAGADAETVQGKPIRIAIANNHMDIIKYLKEKGYKLGKSEYLKVAQDGHIRAMTDFLTKEFKDEKRKKIRKFFGLKESLYEKFTEEGDPIKDMNIGRINQIKKDLKDAGIPETDDIEITDDFEIYYNYNKRGVWKTDKLLDIQLKYLSDEKRLFVESIIDLQSRSSSHPFVSAIKGPAELFEEYIQEALDNKISPKDIKKLVKEFGNEDQNKLLTIIVQKLTQTKEEKKFQEEYNRYIFIGYMDKVPVTLKGKKYYEDQFQVETMVKIDKFNQSSLSQLFGMKMRLHAQYGGDLEAGIFMVDIPKDMMDEDVYHGIPEENRYIIEKYKKKLKI